MKKYLVPIILVVVSLLILVFGLPNLFEHPKYFYDDLLLYYNWGDEVLSGNFPATSYLPLSTIYFTILRFIFADFNLFMVAFAVINLGFAGWVGYLLKDSFKKNQTLLWICVSIIISMGTIFVARFDILPSLLTLLSVILFNKNKKIFAYFILTLAILLKLYPIVILPLFVIWDIKFEKNKRNLIINLLVSALFAAICSIPFINQIQQMFLLHSSRGIEMGSFWANLAMIAKYLGFDVNVAYNTVIHSNDLVFEWSKQVSLLATILSVLTFLVAYLIFYIKSKLKNSFLLVKYSLFLLLIWMIFGKVFSPQYIFWLLPIAVLLIAQIKEQKGLILAWVLAGFALLTSVLYLLLSDNLYKIEPLGLIVFSLRNLLILVFVFLIFRLKKEDYGKQN